jgi:hypothetical protein
MGISLIWAGVALLAGLAIASLLRPKPQQTDMSPNTLEAFKTTSNSEGTVVPVVFGKVRISSNLLWYGNLVTVEVTQEVETGKKGGGKGGSEDVVVGYKYYMDLWYAICVGPNVTITKTYVNDKSPSGEEGISGTLNPGDTAYAPTSIVGQYAQPMNPIAHIFAERQYLGENVASVPTFHFVVNRTSDVPITHANMTYGTNPAAIIHELLTSAGVPVADIVLSTFEEAGDYWNDKGYALNLSLVKQEEIRKIISRVFTFVDGNLRWDEQGRYELKAWMDTDTYDVEIPDKTYFKEFSFTRRTWDDVYTDFRANYNDENQAFSQRTIRLRNTAVEEILGYSRQLTIDLSAYRTAAGASARLWEMMKRLSYPDAQIECTVSMAYVEYRVGDIVRINHDDYGIADADFRIMRVNLAKSDSNEVQWQLQQVVENIFDSNFATAGESEWSEPSYAPVVPYDQDVFELPYNEITGRSPAYLLLCARKGAETGFVLYGSQTGSDYVSKGTYNRFSMHGTLDEDYPSTTYSIDDEIGILFTPDREDPTFLDLARADLFTSSRVAVLNGTELVAFQTVDYEGSASIRLTGVIRGLLHTPISTHSTGQDIWLTNLGDNILVGVTSSTFYLKFAPYFGSVSVDASTCPAVTVNYEAKALTPWPINTGKVVRSGSNLTVTVEPTTQEITGAGTRPIDQQPFSDPVPFECYFEHSVNDTTYTQETDTTFTYSQAGTHTLYVKQNLNGRLSTAVTCAVDAADGTYYFGTHAHADTGLELIRWGTQGWHEVMARNTQRLNDLLYITNLLDVDDTGINNGDALVWNATSEKFEPLAWSTAFPTTTTTTTTTSSSSTTSNTQSSTTSSSTTTNTRSTTSSSTTTTNTASTTSSTASTTSTTASTTSTTTPPAEGGEDVSSGVTSILGEPMGIIG